MIGGAVPLPSSVQLTFTALRSNSSRPQQGVGHFGPKFSVAPLGIDP